MIVSTASGERGLMIVSATSTPTRKSALTSVDGPGLQQVRQRVTSVVMRVATRPAISRS